MLLSRTENVENIWVGYIGGRSWGGCRGRKITKYQAEVETENGTIGGGADLVTDSCNERKEKMRDPERRKSVNDAVKSHIIPHRESTEEYVRI